MKRIKAGLIGLGRFAELHLRCLDQIVDVEVAAVCDVDAERADRVARARGCNFYTDWNRMLERESLDAIHVLTPEHAHVEPAVAALRDGCSVFVEKPLALDVAGACHIRDVAGASDGLLMVGHVCRFDVRYALAMDAIRQGKLGAVRSLYARRNNMNKFFPLYRRTHPFFTLGIHDIDLFRWFTSSNVTEVYARSGKDANGHTDLVWAMLKFENGVIGVVENHWLLPDGAPAFMDSAMEIVGDGGIYQLREPDQSAVLWSRSETLAPPLFSSGELHGKLTGPLLEELRHFYDCVERNAASDILLPDDAVKAVEVAEAVVCSCEIGQPVVL